MKTWLPFSQTKISRLIKLTQNLHAAKASHSHVLRVVLDVVLDVEEAVKYEERLEQQLNVVLAVVWA